MSIQLLDKTRKLNRLLKNAESSEISFSEISKLLKEMLQSNVLVLSKKGKVLGVSQDKSFDRIEELLAGHRGMRIDEILNERLLAILSTKENVNLATLGFESQDIRKFQATIAPATILNDDRL